MNTNKKKKYEDYTFLYHHLPTRPLKYVKGRDGYGWLCDKDIDADGNLREQGCWRCDEMAFPTGA